MYKRKNKRSPKVLTPRVARAAAPVAKAATAAAPVAPPAAAPKKKGKSTSLLGKIADKVADTGLAVLHKIEEIPGVKRAEELVGVRHEE